MMTLVVYDVSDDRVRRLVETKCKDYGLKHIQRSAFIGPLPRSDRISLYEELRRIMKGSKGSVRIYVMNRRLYEMRMSIGELEGFDDDPEYGEGFYIQA